MLKTGIHAKNPEKPVGVWCRQRLHRLEGDNLMRNHSGCRACYVEGARSYQRQSSQCESCGEWFLDDDAWDTHFHYPLGHPESPPDRCYSVAEMLTMGMKRTGLLGSWMIGGSHCRNGHRWTPENTRLLDRGDRRCRECEREATKRYKARKRRASQT